MGVSVIIPCHDMASTLKRAVDSAFNAGADEVLVWRDGPDSDADKVIVQLSATYDRFDAYSSGYRMGVSCVRNELIDITEHEWIIPLDADDELLYIPPIPSNHLHFVHTGWIEQYPDGSEETFKGNQPKMLKLKPLCHATMLFSKFSWCDVRGYDPDFFFGEDYAFQCAMYIKGYPDYIEKPMYKRYVNTNRRTEQAKKYWPVIQQLAKDKFPSIWQ